MPREERDTSVRSWSAGRPRLGRRLAVAAGATLLGGLLAFPAPHPAAAVTGLTVADLNHGTTVNAMAAALVGGGVSISNVSYSGDNGAAGVFSSGDPSILGFSSGIILSSGSVQTTGTDQCMKGVEGPNQCEANSTEYDTAGDAALTALAGHETYDAAILSFDFVPVASSLEFRYVFASDEYNEWANTAYNDVFMFQVNGTNCALVPGTTLPVSINTINGGDPLGFQPQNPAYYRNNDSLPGPIDTEMDGLTTVLTCSATVNPGVTNTLRMAIADASDAALDTNVFIEAGSLVSGTQVATSLSGGGQSGAGITVPAGTAVTDTATLSGASAGTAGGTVDYAVYSDNTCQTLYATAGSKSVTAGVAAASDAVTPPAGVYYWKATYSGDTGNAPGESACGSEVLTVSGSNSPPSLIVPGAQTVQYSDPLSFGVSATDPDAGDSITLSASGLPAGLSFVDNHDGTGSVSGDTTALPGPYTATFSASDGVNPAVSHDVLVTVTKEDCTLTSPAVILSSASAPTPLTTTFGEPDAHPGAHAGKSIAFSATDAVLTPYGPYPATTDSAGVASTTASWGAGVYALNAGFAGDSYYNTCSTTSDTIVTVAPAAAKVTGGGWFSNGTGRTSFGFNAIPDVLGLHGQIQVRSANKQSFHGNVVLTLSGSGGQATWTGTGAWNGVPGYRFSVSVVDNGSSGGKKGDTISLTILPPTGSTPVFTSGGPQPLKGGNITVH